MNEYLGHRIIDRAILLKTNLNKNRINAKLMCMKAHITASNRGRGQPVTTAKINDWSDIHFAYQVARLGTLSAAAEKLDVHHSTVLRRIDALEQRLNTRLFHRHARGYTPTEAGQMLLSTASRTQEEFDRLMGQLAGVDDQLTGSVVVTTVNTLSPKLTPVFAKFQQRHPEISIELIVDARIFKLEYGEAHISLRPGARPKDPDYIVQHLCCMPATVFASAEYIKRYGGMKNLKDVSGHRFISNIAYMSNLSYIEWLHKEVPPEQIYYRASDFNSMMHAAASGIGVAPLSCWLAEQGKNLQPLFKPPKEWGSELWLVTHRDIHRTPKVQALTQFLKEAFADKGP